MFHAFTWYTVNISRWVVHQGRTVYVEPVYTVSLIEIWLTLSEEDLVYLIRVQHPGDWAWVHDMGTQATYNIIIYHSTWEEIVALS